MDIISKLILDNDNLLDSFFLFSISIEHRCQSIRSFVFGSLEYLIPVSLKLQDNRHVLGYLAHLESCPFSLFDLLGSFPALAQTS